MTPKKKIVVAAGLALLVAASVLARMALRPAKETGQVMYGNIDIRQVSLAFNGTDRIVQMLVQEGDRVAAGQLLGRLDTRTLELRVQQARAQIAIQEQALARLRNGSRPEEIQQAQAKTRSAAVEAELATQNLARLQSTAQATQGQGVARQDIDSAQSRLRTAQAGLDAARKAADLVVKGPRKEDIAQGEAQFAGARAELGLIERQLAEAELKSPIDGVVRARLTEPGEMASPQKPVYTLAIMHPKWARVWVAETDLPRIHSGQAATVQADGLNQAIGGTIGSISSVAEFTPRNVQTEALRTSLVYEVRVNVDDPDDRLRLGQPVTVRLNQTTAQ